MTGSFGFIRELIDTPSADTTHAARFMEAAPADEGARALRWERASDLLLVDLSPGSGVVERLPPRPKHRTGERLWIPLSHDDHRVVGPVYEVGLRSSAPLLRIRSVQPVWFVTGVHVSVSGHGACVLTALDGVDASRRKWLERRLQGLKADLLPRLDVAKETRPPDRSTDLPPAAKTVRDTIERGTAGQHHILEFERRGARGIIETLEKRGLVSVLSTGQIVAATHYRTLSDLLAREPQPLNPQSAARVFESSVGVARAILDQFAADGVVDRLPGGIYKVRANDGL